MTRSELSTRAQEIERQFRAMPKPQIFDVAMERENTKDAHVLTGVPPQVLLEWQTIAGTRCIRMRPRNARADREVIFIHGGAFCLMSAMTHHRFAGHIANACNADVLVPDYPLAPEHPFPSALHACAEFVSERRKTGPEKQILMGDSAGGGLALSIACHLRDRNTSLPDAMVLMSPWLDLTLSGPDLAAGQIDDPILSLNSLHAAVKLYLQDGDPAEPGASPINADLSGLPPTLIQSAGHDLVQEDSFRLKSLWQEKESELVHQHFEHMMHSFQMFAGDMPEADEAVALLAEFVENQTTN